MGEMKQLFSKIAAASKEVGGALSADKNNKDQNYDYISADKVLTVAGQALAKQGVVVFPSITSEVVEQVTYSNKYGEKSRYDAQVGFAFVIADGETEFSTTWIGRGNDYVVPDKALYKAITSGHKYFLMKLLNIGAGNEDGEHELPEDATPAQQPQRQQRVSRQQQPPAQPASNGNGHKAQAEEEKLLPFEPTHDAAVEWGFQEGVFKAMQHAQNAYKKLAKDTGWKAGDGGKISTPELFRLWIVEIEQRKAELSEKKEAA